MNKLLTLSINGSNISAPGGVPTGGFSDKGINVIQAALSLMLGVGMILTLVFVILAGIQWAISGGDKQKIASARKRLIFAIVGMLVIVSAFFIVNLVTFILSGSTGSNPGAR